ncbi:MAG: MerR family transcriptional regulator [Bacteroidetes bacterium]|nr:MerR family transcriptional regulator [Bacteroidota bacterium]
MTNATQFRYLSANNLSVRIMAMLDKGITKLYYTIGEVADMVEEEAHVLRYWETEFERLRPRKNRAGKRVYTKDDIDMVFRIRHLLRDEKFTIDGARMALKKEKDEARSVPEGLKELHEIRSFLQKMVDRIGD